MRDASGTTSIEPRWPAAVTIVVVLALFALLPARVRLVPTWFAPAVGVAMLTSISAVGVSGGRPGLLRGERVTTLIFFAIATVGNFVNLTNVIRQILRPSGAVGGIELLASSIGIWVSNVLAFSLMYWQLDRGGPEARRRAGTATPDWQFPQEALNDVMPRDWRPAFVDYLYLGFCTATAFSPTGAQPLRGRAMLLMMLEGSISLVTIVVVAARSINILGA
jgi:hypothetical protein